MAHPVLRFPVHLFVVGRVQLLIANSQVTRPETRTFGYYGPGTSVPGLLLGFRFLSCTANRIAILSALCGEGLPQFDDVANQQSTTRMKLAFLCIAAGVILLLFLLWCMTQLHFRIGSRHLKVLLFGLTIRRIALNNIAHASKREPKGFAERWYSSFKTSHRLLTIERKRGLIKRVCITPQNRYVFLADLKSAVRRVDPQAEWAALRTYEITAGPEGGETAQTDGAESISTAPPPGEVLDHSSER
jgi:hypothetical protein